MSKTDPDKKPNYVTINGRTYYRMRKKVGMYKNKRGEWRPRYKLFYGKNRKDAQRKYDLYMAKPSFEADKPIGELIEQYIETVFEPDSALKDTTKSRYINAFNAWFNDSKLSEMPLSEITGADIQQQINAASVAPSSVKQAVKLLRRFYKYIAAQQIAPDVTMSLSLPEITRKRQDQSIETFTDAELKAFIEKTPEDHRLRLLIVLAINTGARIGELLALTYDDISNDQIRINKQLVEIHPYNDSDKKTRIEIQTTKTPHSIRSVPLTAETMQAVEDHKRWHIAEQRKNGYISNFVFTTSTGSLYYKSSVRTHYTRLCRLVGVPCKGFHVFRHTFGTRLAAAGVPIQTVSALMGHSNITVTGKYYVNIDSEAKKSAIKSLKLY